MNKPDPTLHEIARRAIAARLPPGSKSSSAAAEAMQRACGDLHRILETAIGPAGLQALIDRAIQIAAREHVWLAGVKSGTSADCAVAGLGDAAEDVDFEAAAEGYAALLGAIVWLLIILIGEDLTLRFVRHAWPNVSFSRPSGGAKV